MVTFAFLVVVIFVAALVAYQNHILKDIQRLAEEIRMNQQELIAKFDAATTAAGARIEALIAELKAAGATLTPEQETEVAAIIARLDSLGAVPADPVPAE